MKTNKEHSKTNSFGEGLFEENALQPDQVFTISYEVDGKKHDVLIQWIGEGREVQPGYYIFEGGKYTAFKENVTLTPEQILTMSKDELRAVFPDDEDLNPNEATRVIDYVDGFGWSERGIGQTKHTIAISKAIENRFSK